MAHELITNMRAFFQTNNAVASLENEEPLRSELFNSDQMKRYGKSLAESHKLFIGPGSDHLLERLADNEKILKEANKLLTELIKGNNQIAPAGEWLIDNFYIIEEHIRTAKLHFPKGYSKDLPLLREGNSLGLIRICDIVLQIISHSDGRIDLDSVSRFIKSYQTVTHLQLGELWAIPIMIRLALLENIRRVSARLAIDRVDGNLADYWAGKMIESVEKDPKNLIVIIADMARSHPPIVSAFVSEMTRQLRGKGPDLALPLHWMEQQLSESGLTSGEMVDAEIQKQTADQVSISNSIGSLRFLSAMDWRDFIEAHSIVEQTLREDNGAIYGAMDFSTRDRYRHVVEDIAKNSPLSEHEVACIAIKLMHENARSGDNDVGTSHVGYYLIGHGVRQTKKLAQMHESAIQRIRQTLKTHIIGLYFSFIFLVTLAITIGVLILVYPDTNSNWTLWSIAFLLLLCTSQLSISVINFFSTLLVKPDLLPRMDYSSEIPPEFRTLVVIPSMLANADEIENLAEGLEVRFLANRNNNLHFGLLTDFTDSPQQTLPADQALLDLAHQKIDQLNKKYNREKSDLFFLFHRPRHWNSHENTWMGYERKRGKLTDLNSLLRGGSKESFSLIVGDQSIFPNIKYVITLDADTQLPLSTAWKLVGTMAHPLNHPWYNSRKKRITKGYGILQPRVTVSLPDTNSTLFARMHGNEPGIDPYTRASSDVYQDLFAEGSFIGKGIYEIDAFKKVLDGKFPENNILSHDLLEGCYVRSGLLSDVQLFEKYPTTYRADMKMHSRWTRGDWQIFAWIFPWVTGHKGYWYKNPISGLSRWKIFDNIRRSLVPVALTVLLLLGSIASHSFFMWIIAVLGIIFAPIIITSLLDLIRKPKEVIILQHLRNTIRSITEIFGKTLFMVICLPYEAYSNLSAIARTIWRMLITRKKLLEWNPSANEKAVNHTNLFASYASMWIQPFLSSAVFVYLVAYLPAKIIVAGPLMLLWFVAPVITWRLGQPLVKSISKLTEEQNIFLRKLSRKTWSFFERFVGPEDNWLPPDNFQEQPIAQLAHRTSPTNIGLSLLAGVTAAEFGYITTGQLIELTTRTIHTMKKMERYRGHFYNWYDTQSLDPLFPKYISTVDSGNLAGHLLTLRQGMLAISHQKIPRLRLFEGLRDTLGVLTDTLDEKDIELLKPFKTDLENTCNSPLIEQVEMQFDMEELTKKFISILPMLNNDPESETYWINPKTCGVAKIKRKY